jgi:hypothetical protein
VIVMPSSPVEIPAISWPFPSAKSPHAEQVTELTYQWAVTYRLLPADAPRNDLWAIPEGACRMYPHASPHDTALACQWMIWTTVLDDQHDYHQAGQSWTSTEEHITHVLADGSDLEVPAEAGPLPRALADLCRRTTSRLSDTWARRVADHVAGFVAAGVESSAHQVTPDMAHYIRLRRDSVAAGLFMTLTEYIEATEIPPALFVMPDFQAIYDAANDVLGWFNDLHSVAIESKFGQRHNMVTVVQQTHGYDLATAVQVTHALIQARLVTLQALLGSLPAMMDALRLDPQTRADVERILNRYGYLITGQAGWYDDTDRYTRPMTEPDPIPGYVYNLQNSGAVPRT